MQVEKVELADSKKNIIIKGAKVHNLKNIDVVIPRNQFVVITGLSGSGKSSLAFDTLYAEGQRRYIESLSAYARQFLGKIDKPEVEYIKGISPAIAIEQKVNTHNTRSTVGTSTEIYDYLKLLYARIGITYSPISGNVVKKDTVTDIVNYITTLPEDQRIMLFSPLHLKPGRTLNEQLSILLQQGFTRARANNKLQKIEELLKGIVKQSDHVAILIDRFTASQEEENLNRISDSAQTAFYEGEGACFIEIVDQEEKHFSNRFELDGLPFDEPSTHLFSFNNPVGACKTCEGFGNVMGIDEDLVIPNKNLSVYEGAVACWKGEKMSKYLDKFIMSSPKFDFPIHKPYYDLTPEHKELLWKGNKHFEGLNDFFKMLETNSYKIQYRIMLSRYRGKTKCTDCNGTRLRKDASYVKVAGKSITELLLMPVDQVLQFFRNIELSEYDQKVAKRLLIEIINRLQYLCDVGLGYLTMNRLSSTLSGGESQRINLATSLGSSLVGSMYILDEPSIGLHPRDTERLIGVLKSLQQLGNTVIVVEHDEEIMQAADQIIDIGPLAGTNGGNVVFQGNHDDIIKEKESLTAKYLTGKKLIPKADKRRTWTKSIQVTGARENNLKNIDVTFPLSVMTVVTGVSGSGKTSLVKNVLYPSLRKIYAGYTDKTGTVDKITGDFDAIANVEFVNQNPIGRSSRSNPATYIKAYDDIRTLFCSQKLAKSRNYKPAHFSFNVDGGRCEMCEGEGTVKIEMQFMADIQLPCETCNGKRFKQDILEIKYLDKNIADVLEMTVDDALLFFGQEKGTHEKKIMAKIQPLQDVGLGYVQLGQSSSTLSGGEAQRIKLASFLNKGNNSKNKESIFFIFDEPTTGLHFHDISKLLDAFNALITQGHSLLVIEHNMDIAKNADWLIDLGPEGGEQGGNLVYQGVPEGILKTSASYTAKYLKEKL